MPDRVPKTFASVLAWHNHFFTYALCFLSVPQVHVCKTLCLARQSFILVLQDRWSESELFLYRSGGGGATLDDSPPGSPPSPQAAADLLAWEQARSHRTARPSSACPCER
jgi:hypothetical protein